MSIPLPIPTSFTCYYFFLPYRVSEKIMKYEVPVRVSHTFMDIKHSIAQHAREYYQRPISPYHFVMAQIDKQNFSLAQLFRDETTSPHVFDINYQGNFIFAYEINPEALIQEAIPPLTESELEDMQLYAEKKKPKQSAA